MEITKKAAIVAAEDASLATVMGSALRSNGWSTVRTNAVPPTTRPDARTLVIVEDDDGLVRVMPPPHVTLHEFVCVGSIRSLSALIPLVSRGATVLNQGAPILMLLKLVENALLDRSATGKRAPGRTAAGMVRRQSEAVMLARLTVAEHRVLRGLIEGRSVSDIAALSHHSLNTIRNQVRSILVKLGVRSQVAAVAIAHRAADPDWWFAEAQATLANFGHDPL